MADIRADFEWYGSVYSQIGITNKFKINNQPPEIAVKRLIMEYGLIERCLSEKISGS